MGERLKELVKKPVFWIAVAGVAVVALFLRVRSSATPATATAPQSMLGGGGAVGGGVPVSGGPNIADQLANLDLLGEQQRQKNEQIQFELGQRESERRFTLLGPIEAARAALDIAGSNLQTAGINFQTAFTGKAAERLQKTGISCPGNASPRIGANGEVFCREKTSGNVITTGITNIVQGILQGAASAAPGVAQAYIGQATGTITSPRVQRSRGSSRTEGGMQSQPGQTTGVFGANPFRNYESNF